MEKYVPNYMLQRSISCRSKQIFQMNFAENEVMECKTEDSEQVEEVYNYNETEDGETIVVPTTSEYKEAEEEKNAVRLVQIRFPTSVGGEGRSWLSLVQNT